MPEPGASFGVRKIVSGGQTGADRAALDVAIELGLDHGGWVPKGRRAEDGSIPDRYHVMELAGDSYDARTEANVRDSDATLIVSMGPLTGGSALTLRLAERHRKPVLRVDRAGMGREEAAAKIRRWLTDRRPAVLNVAGPPESSTPGIHREIHGLLRAVLSGGEVDSG